MRQRRLATLIAGATLAVAAAAPATASAGPLLHLDIHHGQTNAIPGGDPGGTTVSTLTQGSSVVNETQRYYVDANSGTYVLHFGADTTTNLPYNATVAQVQSALAALPGIGAGNVSVSLDGGSGFNGGYLGFTVTFTGALAHTNVPQLGAGDGAAPLRLAPEYWFDVDNLGDAPTSGPITLSIQLPGGFHRNLVRAENYAETKWSCPGAPGDATVTCTTTDSLPRHRSDFSGIILLADVDSGLLAATTKTVRATLTGGGSPAAPPVAKCSGGVAACASEITPIAAVPATFGIAADSFLPDFTGSDEVTPYRQAGGHPERFVVPLDFNSVTGFDLYPRAPFLKKVPENTRHLRVDLPPGFLGDPTAVGECSAEQLLHGTCPASSQVGVAHLKTTPAISSFNTERVFDDDVLRVFNMVHPRGAVADLAFQLAGNPIHIKAFLDPERNYAISSSVSDINETVAVFVSKVVLWGTPPDPTHDSERCRPALSIGGPLDTSVECPAGIPPDKAFITTPFDCATPAQMTLRNYDSWDHPGVFGPDITRTIGTFSGCATNQAQFAPTVSIAPTNTEADTPTGLNVEATLPQDPDPTHVTVPPVKRIQVTLPQGVTVNPSFADGLRGCSEAEIGISHTGVPDDDPVSCPDASRIGAVELNSPLLPVPTDFPPDCPGTGTLQGSIYLAQQFANPENSLFAIYAIVHDCEQRGVLVKIPGKLELDPNTGQVTTTFDDLPQFPVDHLSVQFRSGDRAPLINPPTCGTKTIEGTLDTWTDPNTGVPVDSSYDVTDGPGGNGSCSPDAASRPFAPSFQAGVTDPTAAKFSPFVLRMTRADGEQELTKIVTDLPPGLIGKLAGVGECPSATVDAIPTDPGTGQAELDHPSCPASSLIGHANAGSGAGPQPFYIQGQVYLAGPYQGAPYSVAIVTPAVAGGIDLGNVVVRTALHIDPTDSHLHAVSDPIPAVVHGVPIHLRDVRVVLDRDNFTLNPTDCDPLAVSGVMSGAGASLADSADDTSAAVLDPFKVGGCTSLAFAPSLSLALKGGTKRNGHPAFTSVLKGRSGDANIAGVGVTLPPTMQLDQSHIQAPCTRPQFAANQCPAASIIGSATATSPLIDYPLAGSVYLRTGENPLPDVVLDLHGPTEHPVHIVAVGKVDTVHARLRTTFTTVPDAPLTEANISLLGGSKGLLVNNTNLCAGANIASVGFTAHDGDTLRRSPKVAVAGCKKGHKPKKHHRKHKKRHKRHHNRVALRGTRAAW